MLDTRSELPSNNNTEDMSPIIYPRILKPSKGLIKKAEIAKSVKVFRKSISKDRHK